MPDMDDLRARIEFWLEAGPRDAPIRETVDMTAWRRQMLLFSYLAWPTDAARRRALAAGLWHRVRVGWGDQEFRTQMAAWIGSSSVVDSAGPPLAEPPEIARLRAAMLAQVHDAIGNCFEESFKIEGGFDTDPIARSEIHNQLRKAHRAGLALGVLHSISEHLSQHGPLLSERGRPLRGGASLNKAVHVLAGAGVSRKSTLDAWATHKGVAHLAWAFMAIDQLQDAGRLAGNIEAEVNAILAIARHFQAFAVAGNHVSAEIIWTVPASLELLPCEAVRGHLTEKMIEHLGGYIAPQ
jgi:hypothetical protein